MAPSSPAAPSGTHSFCSQAGRGRESREYRSPALKCFCLEGTRCFSSYSVGQNKSLGRAWLLLSTKYASGYRREPEQGTGVKAPTVGGGRQSKPSKGVEKVRHTRQGGDRAEGLAGLLLSWDRIGSTGQGWLGWRWIGKVCLCHLKWVHAFRCWPEGLRKFSREVGLVQFLEAQLKGEAEAVISAFQGFHPRPWNKRSVCFILKLTPCNILCIVNLWGCLPPLIVIQNENQPPCAFSKQWLMAGLGQAGPANFSLCSGLPTKFSLRGLASAVRDDCA